MSLLAGFDLGGTHLKYGVLDKQRNVVFEAKSDTPGKIKELLSLLEDLWNALKKREEAAISSVGFGFPGIFNVNEQKILQSPNYPELDNFNLRPALARFIEVPFHINNDANMAAYGEYRLGAGRGTRTMMLITIGTGVGSGIIQEGKILQGSCGFAGELGHVTVNPDGESCNCGSRGCLETEVSAPKIVKNYRALSKSKDEITSEEVFTRAKQHDKDARQAFAQAGRYLGIGLSIALNLINPEKILIGGGVMKAEEFLLLPALEEARERAYDAPFRCCQIQRATLGNKAGFIGASLWAEEQSLKQED